LLAELLKERRLHNHRSPQHFAGMSWSSRAILVVEAW